MQQDSGRRLALDGKADRRPVEKIWPEIHGRQPWRWRIDGLGEAGGSNLKSVIVAPAAVIPAATARGG